MNQQDSQEQDEGFYPQRPAIVNTSTSTIHPTTREGHSKPCILPSVPIHKYLCCNSRILPEEVNKPFHQLGYEPLIAPVRSGNRPFPSISAYEQYEAKYSPFRLIYCKTTQQGKTLSHKYHTIAKREIPLTSDPSDHKTLKNYEIPQRQPHSQSDDLILDSRFECGNLYSAYRNTKQFNTYHMLTEKDTNSRGYNQWFYFSLQNAQPGVVYTFHFTNLRKRHSLYEQGVPLVLFSLEEHRKSGEGWCRRGRVLSYGDSTIHDICGGERVCLYSLVIEITFPHPNDWVTLSSGLPYSYSRLTSQLDQFRKIALVKQIPYQLRTISYSLSHNQVPYLTIAKKEMTDKNTTHRLSRKQQPKVILILARQHPAEGHSSFVMEEIIRQLCVSESSSTEWLIQNYEFRIFPMLNVDGVIYGNSRCDLMGFDLNRSWRWSVKQILPQVTAVRQEIERLRKQKRIEVCLDLHSHSTMQNMFAYCCQDHNLQGRIFPYLMSQHCRMFHFPSCTYGLTLDKQNTARGILSKIAKKATVLTVETSYFGYQIEGENRPFGPAQFRQMGGGILVALSKYLKNDKESKQMLTDLQNNLQKYLMMGIQDESVASGSDSQPEADAEQLDSRLNRLMSEQLANTVKKKINNLQEQSHKKEQSLKPNLSIESKPNLRDLSVPKHQVQKQTPARRHSMMGKEKKRVGAFGNFKSDRKPGWKESLERPPGNWARQNRMKGEENILILPNEHSPQQQSFRLKEEPTDHTFKLLYKELTHRKRQNSFQHQTLSPQVIDQFSNDHISMTMRRESRQGTVDLKTNRNYSKYQRILKVRRRKGVFKTEGREGSADKTEKQDYKLMRIKSEGPELPDVDLKAAKIKQLLKRESRNSGVSPNLNHVQVTQGCKISVISRLMRDKLTVLQGHRQR